jgi:hypothetical protein
MTTTCIGRPSIEHTTGTCVEHLGEAEIEASVNRLRQAGAIAVDSTGVYWTNEFGGVAKASLQ